MPLDRQTLSVSLSQGVDTKTDPKQVPAGKLLTLENGVFTSRGRIKKRNGHASLGGHDALTEGRMVASFKDQLLAMGYRGETFSYAPSQGTGAAAWATRVGVASTSSVSLLPIVSAPTNQSSPDSAHHSSGIDLFAWEESSGIKYCVVDSTTGTYVIGPSVVIAAGTRPKCLTLSGSIFIFYEVSGSLIFKTYVVATQTLGNAVTVATLLKTGSYYDAAVVVDAAVPAVTRIVVACIRTVAATDDIWCRLINANQSQGTLTALSLATPTRVCVFAAVTAGRIDVGWYDGSDVKNTIVKHSDLTVVTTETVQSEANVEWLGGAAYSPYSVLVYSVSNADASKRFTVLSEFDTDAVVGSVTLNRGVSICSKPVFYDVNTVLVPLFFDSPDYTDATTGVTVLSTENTVFIAKYQFNDADSTIETKLLPGTSGRGRGATLYPMLSETNRTLLPFSIQMALSSTDSRVSVDATAQNSGVVSAVVALDQTPTKAEMANSLLLSGGFLQSFDGVVLAEHGFHHNPFKFTTTADQLQTTGWPLWQYAVCYEWTDNSGQLHRSAPSPAHNATQADVPGTTPITLTIPTLRLTDKPSGDIRLVVYRTKTLGTVFYRCGFVANDATSDTVDYVDNDNDGTIEANAQLYTTGGVLENGTPGGVASLSEYRGRLVCIDSEDPTRLYYSQPAAAGAPVEMSLFLEMSAGGVATALGNVDDKLIVFKDSSISMVFGNGPDATGANSDFTDPPQLISTDCGCVEPRSVARFSGGVMFKSRKGIFLLDRSLAASYIGAEVESFNDHTIFAAQTIAASNQVRFLLSGGDSLVYDSLFGQWSVFTGFEFVPIDGAVYGGVFSFVDSRGDVWQESLTTFTDGSAFVRLKIATSWLQLAGFQGFQRAYQLLIGGEFRSACNLVVAVAHDFVETADQTTTISLTGTAGDLLQKRVFFAKQKCESMRLTIYDTNSGTAGESVSLSALGLEVGAKRGSFKVSAAASQ